MLSGRETLILILHGKIRTTGERKDDMKAKSEKLRKRKVKFIYNYYYIF